MKVRVMVGMLTVMGLLWLTPVGASAQAPQVGDVEAAHAEILLGVGGESSSGPPTSATAISGAMSADLGSVDCGSTFIHEFVAADDVVEITIGDDLADAAGPGADLVLYEFSNGTMAHNSVINCEYLRVWSGMGDEVINVNALDPNGHVDVVIVITAGKTDGAIGIVDEEGKDQVFIGAGAVAEVPPDDGSAFADYPLRILTNGGNDLVRAAAAYTGNIYAIMGGGNDTVQTAGGADRIFLEEGNDRAFTAKNADFVSGGPGDDTIHGNRGADSLFGDEGDDRIFGYSQDDTLVGGPGNDRLHGNTGNDMLFGEVGNDSLFGYADDDMLSGGPGNDLASGNFGNDRVFGDDGRDTLFGADGTDEVTGGEGNDILNGNSGNDMLFGGGGDDSMDGGINNDSCNGQGGVDSATRCETVVNVP